MVPPSLAHYRRFRVESSVEVPLTVDAADARTALAMGLQLLEREDSAARLRLSRDGDGVRADDPETGESFVVRAVARPVQRALPEAA